MQSKRADSSPSRSPFVGYREPSQIPQVVHDVEWVIANKPIDGILQIGCQHPLAVANLLHLGVIVVLNLQLVHVVLGDAAHVIVQSLDEFLLAQQVKLFLFTS